MGPKQDEGICIWNGGRVGRRGVAVVQYRALQGGWKEKKLSGMTSCPDWGAHV